MSFILEALKKSEQQRQQSSSSPNKVRKRTLSTESSSPDRRPYWITAGLLPLILLSGWFLYNGMEVPWGMEAPLGTEVPLEQPPAVNKVRSTPPLSQPTAAKSTEVSESTGPAESTGAGKSAGATSSAASPPQKPVAAAESAPVPRDFLAPPVTRRRAPRTVSSTKTIEKPPEPAVEPRNIEKLSTEPISTLPLYLDLSRELRDRMPRLTMSMHFYTTTPRSRLVRINNHLLHEDEWVDRDLQVIEITPTGATLDFMGKLFEMRNSSR